MSEKIDKTLKKLAAGMLSGKTSEQPGDYEFDEKIASDLVGDPDCPHCGGVGYLRRDLPVGHPDFGKLTICSCRNQQISQRIHQRLFALSRLDELKNLSFENFQPRGRVGLWPEHANSLETAYNQANIYSQKLEGWLLLEGKYGCGKTHLAAAIANFAISIGVPALFVTVPDLLDLLRFAYHDPEDTFEKRFEDIRQAPLLILDDFGTQNATTWAQEKLFQVINYRYANRLPLVVTTNQDLRDIDERIYSRLLDPELVTHVRIHAPDYRRPTSDIGSHELSALDLLSKCTFATFDLRKKEKLAAAELESLERAFGVAREYAETPEGWLVFSGPYGCGKTHLAAAIAHYRRDQGFQQLFVVVPELFDHLRATFAPTSTITLDRRFEEVKTTNLLILDDLSTRSISPWVREKLHQLINFRYDAELPTVFTTADHFDEMDERILSRLRDKRLCDVCGMTAPPYQGAARVRKQYRRKRQ